tara:strand:+ start:3689 stop:4066 length:378 start_codon:yes stop_codon:yes gene_type:complete
MKIKEYEKQELTLKCVELVSLTLVELGQVKDEKHIVILSQSLSNDLIEDFGNLYFEDIQASFRNGVRNTEQFVLNVQTYYKWIKSHRQLIWNESSKEPERQDKRLKYRSRAGTGLKQISNLKQLK